MSSVRRLVGRRGFRRLLAGQTVSALGDWMGTLALMVLVLDLTRSSTAVGGVLVLRLLPAAIAGPVAARVAQRWGRRQVMLAMDASRAVMAAALPLVNQLWWIYLWAFFIEVGGLLFLPARDSAIPDLAGDEEDLPLADSLMLGSSYATIPFGAGLFGLVTFASDAAGVPSYWRFVAVFAVDAATYLVSFAAIQALSEETLDAAAEQRHGPHARSAGFWSALRLPLVRAVMPATLTVALGVGALFSVGVSFVQDVLHASSTNFGVLVALFGVGAAGGLVIAQRFKRQTVGPVRMSTFALGAVVVGMSLAGNLAIAFVGAVLFGMAAATTLVIGMSLLQDRLEGVDRDLAFTAFHVTIRGGLAVAALVAGAAVDLVRRVDWPVIGSIAPPRVVLMAAGIVVMLGSASVHERTVEVAGR